MKNLVENYQKLNITSLAMVPVGCGYGMLDYTKDVQPLLHQYLEQMDIDVYLLHRDTT